VTEKQLEIKPCPFCGAAGEVDSDDFAGEYWVECEDENCLVCPDTYMFATKKEAISAWNKREKGWEMTEKQHDRTCKCPDCQTYWERQESSEGQVKAWLQDDREREAQEQKKPDYFEPDIDTDYMESSAAVKRRVRIKELVEAHWSYVQKVLSSGQDKTQTFTWDQVMEMRKWDYTSAAIHFYGHGFEDAKGEI
jgi:hypothetical protein